MSSFIDLVVSILTFPGTIVHEIAHRFFCDLVGAPVYEVRYFRFRDPFGYVIYARSPRLRDEFLIAIGPLIVNSLLCAVICFAPIVSLNLNVPDEPIVLWVLTWLGISIGMQAFPSNQDAENFASSVRQSRQRGILLPASKTFVIFIRIANRFRTVWFGFVYAIAVAWIMPGCIALFAILTDGP